MAKIGDASALWIRYFVIRLLDAWVLRFKTPSSIEIRDDRLSLRADGLDFPLRTLLDGRVSINELGISPFGLFIGWVSIIDLGISPFGLYWIVFPLWILSDRVFYGFLSG
ncbi:unnamed protein product [Rhizophagus irregularis]|uniref:Uncharacterized protein n=1 Tax=Rhizophagus irregularis TaxID=588596 RepID=A0A916E4R7_9GLOM|nr:unnamed protein product [Rhizophagus irregularis]CAB5360565.1 unnamed protein product [Rhizophagus irregularis]